MNKQENRLTISVLCTLITGIALVYVFIRYHDSIFAVGLASAVFLGAAFLLTQNIIAYTSMRSKSFHVHMKNYIDDISAQIEALNEVQSQLGKANYVYTKQAAQTLASMDTNYIKSHTTLNKNLAALSSMQNKAAKLNLKNDQDNTTKVIATIKDLRNHLNETMASGFDQIQPSNADVINMLTDIVNYMKAQSGGINQGMELQLNNVAHELQNISHSIRNVQMPQQTAFQAAPYVMPVQAGAMDYRAAGSQAFSTADGGPASYEQQPAFSQAASDSPVQDMSSHTMQESGLPAEDGMAAADLLQTAGDVLQAETQAADDVSDMPAQEVSDEMPAQSAQSGLSREEDGLAGLLQADVDGLIAADEPEEEKPFKPTFTVVKNDPEPAPDPADANKMLSPDEIAALFAASAPAEPEPEPEPAPAAPDPADANKMLSPDEIAALFAAAAPAEPEPEPAPAAPDPADANKMLSPDEIAALFAAMG